MRVHRVLGFLASVMLLPHVCLAADQTLLASDACVRYWGADSAIKFSLFGKAFNSDASGTTYPIDCAVGQDHSVDTNDDMLVYFEDSDSTSSYNVACYAYEINYDFSSTVYVGFKYGCSTAGGCATDPGTYTGSNYISFADVSHGGDYQGEFFCYIPGYNSLVKSIVIDEQ